MGEFVRRLPRPALTVALVLLAGCGSSSSTVGGPLGGATGDPSAGTSNAGTGAQTGSAGSQGGGSGGAGGAGGTSGTAGSGTGGGGAAQGGGSGAGTGGAGGTGTAGGGVAGSAGEGGSAGAGACDDYVGLATPEEVALTPRADAGVELLAIRASNSLVAPQVVYERVARDLDAIRQAYPDVASISPRAHASVSDIRLILDRPYADQVVAGSYTAWDCLNDLYGLTSVTPPNGINLVTLSFAGRFHPTLLGDEYRMLLGVLYAGELGTPGDGDDIWIDSRGDAYHWIFSVGSGDCPSGCINHSYWGFTTNADGDITYQGSSADDSLDQDWFDTYRDRSSFP